VDTHVHAGLTKYEPVESLIDQMGHHGVDHAVLVQHMGMFDNDYLIDCARRHPGRFAIACLVNPEDPHATATLEAIVGTHPAVQGIRLYLADLFAGIPGAIALWEKANDLGLNITMAGTLAHLASDEMVATVRRFTKARLHVEHLSHRRHGIVAGMVDRHAPGSWRVTALAIASESRVEDRVGGSDELKRVFSEVKQVIVGQDTLIERLLVALLARGHILLEGVPGLAKTLAVKTIAEVVGGTFRRIQFTPDLVPADLVGTRIYRQATGDFGVELGPVFANLLLADEINRAPAKVQSALLEVMQERQVTIGGTSYAVPDPFLVLATQNPIEHDGTYALPEAQVDRFMFKTIVGYPSLQDELEIVARVTGTSGYPGESRGPAERSERILAANLGQDAPAPRRRWWPFGRRGGS
ncbi:MAG: hypothetical protein EBT22_05330, partial [Chloroflexi bacterium]|nr:hypothetical protein [Chloroflexota bacterium]